MAKPGKNAQIPCNPFAMRLGGIAKKAAAENIDALLVFSQANRLSLTGVDCDNGLLAVEPGRKTVFYTDFRYTVMAERTAPWLETRTMWKAAAEAKTLARLGRKWKRIGYEGSISAVRYLRLKEAFPDAELVDVQKDLLMARAVKTPGEIESIRAAEALTCEIWEAVRRSARPGMTEKEIQRKVRALMNERADGEAFETIICAGPNAAECHHVPDATVWKPGAPLLADLGARAFGVCSDMTRNIVPEKPSPLYRKIYSIVLEANMAAIAAVKPGAVCGDIDKIARSIIAKAGYGPQFGHSLGHGVGFEIHESPNFAPKQTAVLEPGMTITVEPGIYLPGKLGVRIEDLVLVTKTGCEVLSAASPK